MMHLTKNDMRAFDRALVEAIQNFHPNPAYGCFAYSMLGAMVLNKIVGGHPDFFPQCGARSVKISPGDENGPYCITLDPDVVRNGEREFHCWIARRSTEEIIDFTTRYVKAESQLLGLPWERKPMPDFIWHKAERIHEDLWISYRPVEDMSYGVQMKFAEWHKEMPPNIKANFMPVIKKYIELGGNTKGLDDYYLRGKRA